MTALPQGLVLQWGRDRMIAEISPAPVKAPKKTALQWGRDRMIAEIGAGSNAVVTGRIASMGPRSDDRGNDTGRMEESLRGILLQWGRDRMIAEIQPRGLLRSVSIRFNGAAIG